MEACHVVICTIFLFYVIISTKCFVENLEIVNIKGISIENGSLTIPYSYINDDYCDCFDASDEPSTSACPNGTFYCTNKGSLPFIIPSSRVNDGICDCCDGSDEWTNNVQKGRCYSSCEELNHATKIEANRVDNLYAIGFKIRAKLVTKGIYLLKQKKNKMFQLLALKRNAQYIRSNTMKNKEKAEAKKKKAIEEEKLRQQNEAFKIFSEIDSNKNNKIEVDKLIAYNIVDQNQDDFVSQNESNNFMEGKKIFDLNDFMSNGWKCLKLLRYKTPKEIKHHPSILEVKKDNLIQDNKYHINNETEEYNVETVNVKELLFTEKTKIIIHESKEAHKLFEEADRKLKDIQRKISDLQKSLINNYGLENEFAALYEQCYELTNQEYTYKLCLFEKVTQRSVKGGSEVNLGVWKDWVNFSNNDPKYHTMLYDKGQYCLNHYQRFTFVHLSCGLKPKLISVTEPNHCEYSMEFELPSVCVRQDAKYSNEFKREEL
ncbi:glucosidase 2 subunit beta-like isoform X2 [Sipha flava]|uniref:Glucosidase 2 subunit beta n=1 Tax=Sipha flava TaxID=143950 RepID=A0A8B8FH64_9HEMI|nr:glucosidase 2 subunit beta-like isoform X2 [Sipha flava]